MTRAAAALAASILVAACATLATAQAVAPGDLELLAPGARIDAARARINDEALSGEERLRALRDLMEALDARLRMRDIPPETRARDAAELAESALTAAAWEGVQSTALVGVLTPSMRDRAQDAARAALAALDTPALRAHVAPDSRAPDETLRVRTLLARARAGALLRASSSNPADRAAGLEALRAVRETPALLTARTNAHNARAAGENAEAEAQRLTLLGLLALDEGKPNDALDPLERAGAVALSPRTKAEATLAHAFAVRAVHGPRAALDRIDALARDPEFSSIEALDPLVRILRADARRRIALAGAELAQGDALAQAARDAAAPYLALARERTPGIAPLALRTLLLEKAAASGGPLLARAQNLPADALALERLARATASDDAPPTDDASLAALGAFAPDALWHAASHLREWDADAPAQRDAARAFLALAELHPDDPRAAVALGAAAAAAQRHATLAGETPESLAVYERALLAALAHAERTGDPALRVDSLRFEIGRVAALQNRHDVASEQLARVTEGDLGLRAADLLLSLAQRSGDEGRIAQAAATLESRARAMADAPGAADALARALAVGRSAEVRAAIGANDPAQARAAAERLAQADPAGAARTLRTEAVNLVERLAAAEREQGDLIDGQRTSARVAAAVASPLVELSRAAGAPSLDGDRVLLARAQRLTGDPSLARDAASTLEDVIARAGRAPELLAELGESLLASGQDERAFPVYRELSGAARPDDSRTAPLHWLAWGRMLTILADNNADGSRSAAIRAQAERLRLVDPNLGGEPHASRIRRAIEGAR